MGKKGKRKLRISVQLEEDLVDKIDVLAEKYNMTRSHLMRNMLKMGYDDAQLLENVGVLPAFHFGMNVIERFKKALKEGKVEVKDGRVDFPVN